MKRIRAKAIALQPEGDAMNKWMYVSLHAAAAAAFIFLLQRFFLNATLESSLLWAVVFAGCAATLAYKQTNR
jgi:TRAP-type C4-dicarboxylate transport system permease small subunit